MGALTTAVETPTADAEETKATLTAELALRSDASHDQDALSEMAPAAIVILAAVTLDASAPPMA